MSAQAGRTPETPGSGQQVTPVIIKTGGDLDAVAGKSPVTINLENKTFESPDDDSGWRSAKSTVNAGMISLEIQDGDKTHGPFHSNPQLEGTRLQIVYGRDMLIFDNEAVPGEPHQTSLVIKSPVPFQVKVPGKGEGQWIESTASFPAHKPLVIFAQGTHVFAHHQCKTDDVEITLYLDWDETGG